MLTYYIYIYKKKAIKKSQKIEQEAAERREIPESSQSKSKVPMPFAKDGKVVPSREICQYFNENNVSILFVNN